MIRTDSSEHTIALHNPLDGVEEILSANNWVFSRTDDHELAFNLHGAAGEYDVFFMWQEDMQALQLCCQYNMTVESAERTGFIAETLAQINQKLWLGHFDIAPSSKKPTFRYACLLGGLSDQACLEQIETLLELCLSQCEKNHPAFQILAQEHSQAAADTLSLALMETKGRS